MNDRTEILRDQDFWIRVEHTASEWLASAAETKLRRFWIDGFIPQAAKNTKRGLDVEGRAWVGEGPQMQYQYVFIASVPQKLLHKQVRRFCIENLFLDEAEKSLRMLLAGTERGPAPDGA